ncbi:MAG: bifunctional hydroxymethylpyrimidine kinase/phosphomethylpyrimidine kinase [Actinobacteria bacterium]|nr:MAG: bifunctional hydroxymethylpyrimidine kinase/phosphomethylpyrimidine kinase [Actinomycetota bacterium]
MTPGVVLTIAGSDPTAGAGIQADLKTFAAYRLYGCSVITAVTSQNTRGVDDVFPVPATVVGTQLAAVLSDFRPAAVKVGMLATAEIAAVVAAKAREGALPNLVLDPVLSSSSGFRLGVTAAVKRLLPYATVITPNRDEASALLGWQVASPADMAGAAGQLAAEGAKYVVVTGGDAAGDEAIDAMWTPHGARFLHAPRVATRNTHGTGCTFAAAIAARLALGDSVPDALASAKEYVTRALQAAAGWQLGGGQGPLNHLGF